VIQISLKYGGKSASYIFKTSSKKVEQIKTISEKQEDATIDINVDLKEVVNSFDNYSLFSISKNLSLVKQMRNTRGVFNLVRLSFALTTF